MFRVIGAAFGFAILVAVVTGSQTAGTVTFFAGLVVLIVPLLAGRTALKCPACRKRVKLGAVACHHCGRAVGHTRSFD